MITLVSLLTHCKFDMSMEYLIIKKQGASGIGHVLWLEDS